LAKILEWQGATIWRVGRYEAAQQLVQQSLALLDDPALAGQDTRAQRASIMGWIEFMAFYLEGVDDRRLAEERLALYQELGDRWRVAGVLGLLGSRAFYRGDLDEAKQQLGEALALWQELGDQWKMGGVYQGLADVARVRGELDEAEHLYWKAIKILREIRDPGGIRWAQLFLGQTLMLAGKFARARRQPEENLESFGHLGDTAACRDFTMLGSVDMYAGEYARARIQAETALALAKRTRYRWGIARSLSLLSGVTLAEAESRLGAGTTPPVQHAGAAREAYAEARRLAQESAAFYREVGMRHRFGLPLAVLGVAARGLGDVAQAQHHLCEALRVAGDIGDFWPLMLALPAAALLLADRGEQERAVELYALASRYPFVANSQWFEDVFGRHIAAVAAALPPEVVAMAQERGRARDLDATVAELLERIATF